MTNSALHCQAAYLLPCKTVYKWIMQLRIINGSRFALKFLLLLVISFDKLLEILILQITFLWLET